MCFDYIVYSCNAFFNHEHAFRKRGWQQKKLSDISGRYPKQNAKGLRLNPFIGYFSPASGQRYAKIIHISL